MLKEKIGIESEKKKRTEVVGPKGDVRSETIKRSGET
jgi:hypothetical protein